MLRWLRLFYNWAKKYLIKRFLWLDFLPCYNKIFLKYVFIFNISLFFLMCVYCTTFVQVWEKKLGVKISDAANAETYIPEQLASHIVAKSYTINRVGFIGLGAMGFGMATHLLNSNFSVLGYDVSPQYKLQILISFWKFLDWNKKLVFSWGSLVSFICHLSRVGCFK